MYHVKEEIKGHPKEGNSSRTKCKKSPLINKVVLKVKIVNFNKMR